MLATGAEIHHEGVVEQLLLYSIKCWHVAQVCRLQISVYHRFMLTAEEDRQSEGADPQLFNLQSHLLTCYCPSCWPAAVPAVDLQLSHQLIFKYFACWRAAVSPSCCCWPTCWLLLHADLQLCHLLTWSCPTSWSAAVSPVDLKLFNQLTAVISPLSCTTSWFAAVSPVDL
jgi:hypothetical protein